MEEANKGAFRAEIELENGGDVYLFKIKKLDRAKIRRMTVRALVNTGARRLFINSEVQEQLDLPVIRKEWYCPVEGSDREVDIVGPIEVRFMNRTTTVDAVVLPDISEVRLGVIPIRDMDILVDIEDGQLRLPPDHKWEVIKHI